MKSTVVSALALATLLPALTLAAHAAAPTTAPAPTASPAPSATSTARSATPKSVIATNAKAAIPPTTASVHTIDPEKEKLIREFLHVTQYDTITLQSVDQMIAGMKAAMPQAPAEFWTTFRAKIHIEDLIQMVLPIYDKYYTKEDLTELLKFYASPLGQKVIAATPGISRESVIAGQAWGAKIGAEAAKEVGAPQ